MKLTLIAISTTLFGLAGGVLLMLALWTPRSPDHTLELGVGAKEPAELAVLGNWVGVWDVTMTLRFGDEEPRGVASIVTTRWVLDGRFVEQNQEHPPKDNMPAFKNLMTYDAGKNAYRSWTFFGFGFGGESVGIWDGAKRTMTWTSKDPSTGRESTTVASFPEDGVEVWSVVDRDGGKIVSEVHGKCVQRK